MSDVAGQSGHALPIRHRTVRATSGSNGWPASLTHKTARAGRSAEDVLPEVCPPSLMIGGLPGHGERSEMGKRRGNLLRRIAPCDWYRTDPPYMSGITGNITGNDHQASVAER
jgi:hypothetical protein